jgi:hypothetical protein
LLVATSEPLVATSPHQALFWCLGCGRRSFLEGNIMIRKLKSGQYRLYSRKVDPKTGKHKNLGTFNTREEAEQHERAVQFFKHRH